MFLNEFQKVHIFKILIAFPKISYMSTVLRRFTLILIDCVGFTLILCDFVDFRRLSWEVYEGRRPNPGGLSLLLACLGVSLGCLGLPWEVSRFC